MRIIYTYCGNENLREKDQRMFLSGRAQVCLGIQTERHRSQISCDSMQEEGHNFTFKRYASHPLLITIYPRLGQRCLRGHFITKK